MSVDQAISCYGDLTNDPFSDSQTGGDGKFKASKLEKVIEDIVKVVTGQKGERMLGPPPITEGCKCRWSTIIPCVVELTGLSFVIAMAALNMSARIPRLFCTYKAQEN